MIALIPIAKSDGPSLDLGGGGALLCIHKEITQGAKPVATRTKNVYNIYVHYGDGMWITTTKANFMTAKEYTPCADYNKEFCWLTNTTYHWLSV